MDTLQISVPAILRAKAPNTRVPGFVIRWLQRIVHEEEMNTFLREHPNLEGFDFIDALLREHLRVTLDIEGADRIPTSDAPLIFACNHPLGGPDGVMVAQLIHHVRKRELKVIVNDLLMYVAPLASIFTPVNKVGAQKRQHAELQAQMWQSQCDVLSFPAGMCSRKQKINGKTVIQDLQWKHSFIKKSITMKRDVVPVFFDGRNSQRFYRIAYWRKRLRIPFNIEMLFLVDEMYRTRGKHFTLRVGQPISWQTFDDSRSPLQWANYVKEIVYALNE